jgi:DNA-binding LacI/PurR family transcriptional regulator
MTEGKRAPVTAMEVARLAGVSQSAVSRAFTPGANVSAAMRAKIMKVASQVGYRPNALARSLITGRSHMIGVAMGNLSNPFMAAALEELCVQLAHAKLRLLLFSAHHETPIEQVIQYQIEALVMLSVPITEALAKECEAARVPIVLFNRSVEDFEAPCVIGDNETGARAIAAFLLAGGHERIAFIGLGEESTSSREREAAFTAYLAEQGQPLYLREMAGFSQAGAASAMRRLLLRPDRPEAVFCANDHIAMIALEVAQAEFGLEPGRDISIVGFEDVPQASRPGVSLTTYSLPIGLMVERTIEVIDQLRNGETPPARVIIPGELIVRGSARKPHWGGAGRKPRQPEPEGAA